MAKVEIYSTMFCPFCFRAKALLKSKGAEYTEIDVMMNAAKKREMMERAGGGHTVPQIFIDDVQVGGSDELAALEMAGKLEPMLAG